MYGSTKKFGAARVATPADAISEIIPEARIYSGGMGAEWFSGRTGQWHSLHDADLLAGLAMAEDGASAMLAKLDRLSPLSNDPSALTERFRRVEEARQGAAWALTEHSRALRQASELRQRLAKAPDGPHEWVNKATASASTTAPGIVLTPWGSFHHSELEAANFADATCTEFGRYIRKLLEKGSRTEALATMLERGESEHTLDFYAAMATCIESDEEDTESKHLNILHATYAVEVYAAIAGVIFRPNRLYLEVCRMAEEGWRI